MQSEECTPAKSPDGQSPSTHRTLRPSL